MQRHARVVDTRSRGPAPVYSEMGLEHMACLQVRQVSFYWVSTPVQVDQGELVTQDDGYLVGRHRLYWKLNHLCDTAVLVGVFSCRRVLFICQRARCVVGICTTACAVYKTLVNLELEVLRQKGLQDCSKVASKGCFRSQR